MQNEYQNESQTETTETKQDYRLEFIPLSLADMQFARYMQVGNTMIEALDVLHKALAEINPQHPAFATANAIMAEGLPILSELHKGGDIIDEARKRANLVLYGVEEIYPKEETKEETQEEKQDAESAA